MPTAPISHPTPDPLMETQLFWARNKMPILIAIAAILIALVGYGAYQYRAARRAVAAAAALAQAKTSESYQKVISDYQSTPAAASAYLLLAAEQRMANQFADANLTLQKFLHVNPKHELVATAKMAIAANHESLGNTEEALDTYRRLAADHPKDFNAPLAMLAQVSILKRTGKIDEARKVCETILTQYRESFASAEATQQLRQLKPADVPAAPSAAAAPNGTDAAADLQPGVDDDANAAPAQGAGGASVPPIVVSPAASAAPTP